MRGAIRRLEEDQKCKRKVLSEVAFQTPKGPTKILIILTVGILWLIPPTPNLLLTFLLSQISELNYLAEVSDPICLSLDSYCNRIKYYKGVE